MEIGRTLRLPEYVALEVLVKLPVKSLLRFTCVSKEWYALIKSSYFTAVHLHRSNPNHLSLFLKRTWTDNNYRVDLLRNDEANRLESLDLSYFLNISSCNISVDIVGSSNGLVCLSLFDSRTPIDDVAAIIVWNPATKRFRLLPKVVPALKNYHLYQPLLGFVYLDDISDYKLVKILPGKADVAFQAQVFTGSTNSWRDVECYSSAKGCRRFYYYKCTSFTLNEKLYSLLGSYNSFQYSILSFNLSDEVFKVIPLPLPSENIETKIQLLSWKNAPAFLACAGFSPYEFWVMSEASNNKIEGTQMQWTKQFVIKRSLLSLYRIFSIYWKDQFLYSREDYQEDGENLLLYDPVSQKKRSVIAERGKDFMFVKAVDFIESLLPV